MDIDHARTLIRDFAQTGCTRLSKHCRERMEERGVDMSDYLQVLMWGEITELKKNPDYDDYICIIKGNDIEGDSLTLKVAILEEDHAVLCITVHG